jgi:formylglycine-generating enzyme required for sulfatase activity
MKIIITTKLLLLFRNIITIKVSCSVMVLLFLMIGVQTSFAQIGVIDNNHNSHQEELQRKFFDWRDKIESKYDSIRNERPDEVELSLDDIIPAPENPELWPLWRDWLQKWRIEKRESLRYVDTLYNENEFGWVSSSFVETKIFMFDSTFYDPSKGQYTVDKYLNNFRSQFGGVDVVILWQSYPRIGFDERNEFDLYRDMPGGLKGLRRVVRQFHNEGIKVLLCYNPWDGGTRRVETHAEPLAEIAQAIEADGIYLDTWFHGNRLRPAMDTLAPGLVFETELAVSTEDIATTQMSWGQSKPWKPWLFRDLHTPGVVRNVWFERRHKVRPTNRWEEGHSDELHLSWMNGTGTLVWENDFGVWNGWSERDKSILRSMYPIQHRYTHLFTEGEWMPLVGKKGENVFASLWKDEDKELWTLVNRAEDTYSGSLLDIPHTRGLRYFDLIKGEKAQTTIKGDRIEVKGSINPRGIGCILAIPKERVTNNFKDFLEKQAEINRVANWDPGITEREQILEIVPSTNKYERDELPIDMVAIERVMVELNVEYKEDGVPTGFNEEALKKRKVELSPYAIDLTPVTNRKFAKFLEESGYQPPDETNFLKHWINGNPPKDIEDHPVVWVSLEDARAYAKWAEKRLPTEEEWQYAAQGPIKLKWPWGNKWRYNVCNNGTKHIAIDKLLEGTESVYKYPEGRSPFGLYDMAGNTWEWTESLRTNGNTRSVYLKGGSYFEPVGSGWYPWNGAQSTNHSSKYLLMSPGVDRSSTIGFRCVVDIVSK